MEPETGRVYHPGPNKTGGIGLVSDKLNIQWTTVSSAISKLMRAAGIGSAFRKIPLICYSCLNKELLLIRRKGSTLGRARINHRPTSTGTELWFNWTMHWPRKYPQLRENGKKVQISQSLSNFYEIFQNLTILAKKIHNDEYELFILMLIYFNVNYITHVRCYCNLRITPQRAGNGVDDQMQKQLESSCHIRGSRPILETYIW